MMVGKLQAEKQRKQMEALENSPEAIQGVKSGEAFINNKKQEDPEIKTTASGLSYKIINEDTERYRESMYRSRSIVRERVRLAMGMSLRPEDRRVHLTAGIEESNISEKYYEPPLMQVIPSACNACPENRYEVTNKCMGCIAHPCREVCPKGAIEIRDGKTYAVFKNQETKTDKLIEPKFKVGDIIKDKCNLKWKVTNENGHYYEVSLVLTDTSKLIEISDGKIITR